MCFHQVLIKALGTRNTFPVSYIVFFFVLISYYRNHRPSKNATHSTNIIIHICMHACVFAFQLCDFLVGAFLPFFNVWIQLSGDIEQ